MSFETVSIESRCSVCQVEINNETAIRRYQHVYCGECWINHVAQKFRKRVIEAARSLKPDVFPFGFPDVVSIMYDGSPRALALLNLIQTTILSQSESPQIKENSSKPGKRSNLRLPERIELFVVLDPEDIGGPGCEEKQSKHLTQLKLWIDQFRAATGKDVQIYFCSIEQGIKLLNCSVPMSPNSIEYFEYPLDERHISLPKDPDALVELQKVLSFISSQNEKKNFLSVLRDRIIKDWSRKCEQVFLPDDQTSLAIKMFSMMSHGRGIQMPSELSFISKSAEAVFLKPLIDLSSNDLTDYLSSLQESRTGSLINKKQKRKMKIDTVERQCNEFIVQLQSSYPSTVSTLTKIGSKLVQDFSHCDIDRSCDFCQEKKDEGCDDEPAALCFGCKRIYEDMMDHSSFLALLKGKK